MAQDTPPIILFTYPESVVGRRTEWYLTLRGIPYYTCRVDSKMPRPVLDRLGIHYRRIPIMCVGRDIYCDSRCIIDHLERLYIAVPRLGPDPERDPFSKGIELILQTWAFDTLFSRTAQMIPADATLALSKEWLADRSELTGIKFDGNTLEATRPDALSHARLHLGMVENYLLADGRKWLQGGDHPSVSDVNVLWIFDWMLRPKERMGMRHAYPDLLDPEKYPKTFAWVDRIDQAMQAARRASGEPKRLSDDEAVSMVEKATFWQPDDLVVDATDPSGLRKGDKVDLIALDSAPATGISRRDVGKLEGLTVTSATISTTTQNGVDARIHYQRANVRVASASDKPRLTASEIPKL